MSYKYYVTSFFTILMLVLYLAFLFHFLGYNITDLVQEAQIRWLKPGEVLFILQNFEEKQLTNAPPQKPPSKILHFYLCVLCFEGCTSITIVCLCLSYLFDWMVLQMVPCFCLTRESFGFFVKMGIAGGGKRTGELLGKHMNV